MDEIIVQAISNITIVLESFLPPPIANVAQNLIVIPKMVKPTGVGGYIGVNTQPGASLYGRHIQAISEVSLVSTDGLDNLLQAASNITTELLSQDRATLRNSGIFKIDFDEMSDISHSGTGNNTIDSRCLRFALEFEFIPLPLVSEGHINDIEYNLELALANGKASFFQLNFADSQVAGEDPLTHFNFFDDPNINATSPLGNWGFNAATGSIHQTEDVRGGGTTLAKAKKAGTQALILDAGSPYLARNMILKADLLTGDTDGIGFVFRWQDQNNFYYYLMSARHDYHVIGKKNDGNYSFLELGGNNQTLGFSTNQVIHAKLLIEDHQFQVYMNDTFILSGSDSDITDAGRVGFISHRNADAHFMNIQLIRFST